MSVRVRFAPSPTGFLHVGGLRTALYNYLFAKKNNGKIILRIEDTDRTRLVENAVENLIENMRWAGIEYDESVEKGGDYGPYVQSERLDIYKKYSDKLIEAGNAYYAFDTAEEIEEMRKKQQEQKLTPKYDRKNMKNSLTLGEEEVQRLIEAGETFVVRMKVEDDKEIKFSDMIRGDITVMGKDIDDQVLMKSDGFPTYHMANIVDDHLMHISHVIRGEEWLPSTPKHVLLYEYLGLEAPKFAHLPLLLNKNKAKLSKRHGDVAVEDFRSKGYIKDAFVNFIALLGWNPSADEEIYSMEELIDKFNIEKVNKAGAVFDLQKLEWMNNQYLQKIDLNDILEVLKPILDEKGFTGFSDEYIKNVADLVRERVNFAHEIVDYATYFFTEDFEYDKEFIKQKWNDDAEKVVKDILEIYKTIEDFNHDNIFLATKSYSKENKVKMGAVMLPLRLVLTGRNYGAGMIDTIEIIGKEKCINRINKFLEMHKNG